MQTSVPAAEYARLCSDLAVAREQFKEIQRLINLHYGDRSTQAIRAEQVTHSVERLEIELARFDAAAEEP
jgi:hypothetical protein